MLISEIRKERITEGIMKALLQKGKVPTPEEVSRLLDLNINGVDLDKPLFKFRRDEANTVINSEKYNRDIETIYQDLQDIGTVLQTYSDMAEEVFSYFNINKVKLDNEIDYLLAMIEDIKLKDKYNVLKASFHENFSGLGNIDAANNTANIDTAKKEASIPLSKDATKKYDLDQSNTKIEIVPMQLTGLTTTPLNGDVYNILEDGNKNVWQFQQSAPIQVTNYLNVNITIDKAAVPDEINSIELKTNSIKSMDITLHGSVDGIAWDTVGTRSSDSASVLTFVLPQSTYTFFKITMQKKEADKLLSNNNYAYIYGIEYISFIYKEYLDSAVLQLLPIKVPKNSTSFVFFADDSIPNGTSISYSYGFNDVFETLEKSTENDLIKYDIDNFTTEKKAFKFNSSVNPETTNLLSQLTTNGVRFFSLGTVNDAIIKDSCVLTRGINCWKIKTKIGAQSDSFIPTNRIFESGDVVTTYVPISSSLSLICNNYSVQGNGNVSFSCSVYCNKDVSFSTSVSCNTNHGLYINGTCVESGLNSVTIPVNIELYEGWNTIEMIVYCTSSKSVTISLLPPVLDSSVIKIYADKDPLEQVSLHDLRYNTHPKEVGTYAIEVVDNQTLIILNNFVTDIDYLAEYNCSTDQTPEVTIKADLYQDTSDIRNAPVIKHLSVRFA